MFMKTGNFLAAFVLQSATCWMAACWSSGCPRRSPLSCCPSRCHTLLSPCSASHEMSQHQPSTRTRGDRRVWSRAKHLPRLREPRGAKRRAYVHSRNVCQCNLSNQSRTQAHAPSLRSWIRTTTARPSLYHFEPDLQRSKGARENGTTSRRLLTAESAAPTTGANMMACCMASHACLAFSQPLPLLSHVGLLPNSTSIALTGISTIDPLPLRVHRRRP